MISGNIIIAFFVMQYGLLILKILNHSEKAKLIKTNQRIEKLRKDDFKTIIEQKEFIQLKYGHEKDKGKFNFWDFLKGFVPRVILILGPLILLNKLGFKPEFFTTLIISVIITTVINKILGKFNLQRQDGIDTLFKK